MKSLLEFPKDELRSIRAVLTDIDDTLTIAGRLPACSYQAMENLRNAGVIVVPVTGRPAGWCDLIAGQWPVDGVIGENGAFCFSYSDVDRTMHRDYAKTKKQRADAWQKLEITRDRILAEVPGAAISADQPYRESDLAIDFCEDIPPLNTSDIEKITAIFREYNATAKVSSIHVNGWFGNFDKLTMSRSFLEKTFGISIESNNKQIIFVGDSPNDSPMFDFFTHSVGVANVQEFEETLPAAPTWVTKGYGAHGFVEIANMILSAR